jgi:hypothetical protein
MASSFTPQLVFRADYVACISLQLIHDSRPEPNILNKYTKIAVGDGTYGSKAMNEYIF